MSDTKYHIAHIIASLQGGAAQHVLHISLGMNSQGHPSTIIAPNDNPGFVEQLQSLGIRFQEVDVTKTFSRKTVVALRKLLRSDEFTHIHLHGHRAAAVVRFSSMGMKIPVPLIYTVHGYHPCHYKDSIAKQFANSVEWLLESKIKHFICVSESTKDELVQAVPKIRKRCTVIHNGIPLLNLSNEERLAYKKEFRDKHSIPQEAFVIGTVARLQWQKSVHRLLQAFSLVSEKHPEMHLVLVGTGPERVALEELSQELRCDQRIHFLGNVDNPRPVYCLMDLFVLPSLWEGMPLTVLEAWDSRIPVIATDVSGSRDIIEDGVTGFIATNTATGIAQEIESALKEKGRFAEIVSEAKNRLHSEYSVEQMVKKTIRIYKKSMKDSPKKAQ